ncbi:hypothetical protein ACFY3U_07805 [Micromonospora sp. NPDC000089]|uniref:hypothetical protein n=1 Tax=unclassified Micromonospora TaxID=2617518 RepID=UPI0036C126B8
MAEAAVITAPEAVEPSPVAARPRAVGRRLVSAAAWTSVLVVLVLAWWWTDTPVANMIAYPTYWLLCLVLPGALVHRALRGSRGNLQEDLGYGAATGLLLELAAWCAATATGQQASLRWWPVPVVLLFLAVPRLRRHWRMGTSRPLPVGWDLAMAALSIVVICWAATQWRDLPLPPVEFIYYQDLLYHLGFVHELTRTMPFELPQVAGEPLRYHYLSDAHMASASLITGSQPAIVLLRLWLVPVAVTAMVVTAGLARDLSGSWWAGPVAAAGGYVGVSITLGTPTIATGTMPLSLISPSQTYMLPLLALLAGLCMEVVRGRPLGPGWALTPALGLACAGAKSSSLPPLIAGLALAVLVAGGRARRVPWAALSLLAVLVGAMAVGYRLFAGGGAGVLSPQVFGLLRFLAPYSTTIGAGSDRTAGGLLPPGLAEAGVAGWLFCFAVLVWWVVMQAPRFVGLLMLARRGERSGAGDPAAWLIAGATVAGTGATWSFFHPSVSQIYFYTAVIPFGALLTAWLLAAMRPPWPVLAVAAALGVIAQLTLPASTPPGPDRAAWLWGLADPVARVIGLCLLAALLSAVLAHLVSRRRVRGEGESSTTGARRPRAMLVAGMTAALLAASVAEGVAGPTRMLLGGPAAPPEAGHPLAVTEDEMRAALWLDATAGPDDVVATNVHCRPAQTRPHCDARAFWVTGLGGRRALVESWGYTDEALAANGRDGFGYPRQPAPDPAVFAFNDGVFTDPTPTALERMRRKYQVRWLLADSRAGQVSPELARLARVRYVAGPVTIYQLDPP